MNFPHPDYRMTFTFCVDITRLLGWGFTSAHTQLPRESEASITEPYFAIGRRV